MHTRPRRSAPADTEAPAPSADVPAPAGPPVSATARVYLTLRQRILDGDLAGGDMVGEQAVADELGVSRTPVREALGRLQSEGWLTVHPRRGAVITTPTLAERQDVLDARALLEHHGVRRAIEAGAAADLVATLRELVAAQLQAHDVGDLGQVAVVDAAFHAAIVAAAGNAILDSTFAGLRDRQERMTTRALWRRVDVGARVLADHGELADLIEAGDVAGFDACLARHMTEVHR